MGSRNNGMRRQSPEGFSGQVPNQYGSQQDDRYGSIRAQQVAATPMQQASVSQIDPYTPPSPAEPMLNGAPLSAEPMAQAPNAYDALRQSYIQRPAAAPTAYDTARQALVNRGQSLLGGNTAYDQLRKLYMTRGY